MDTDDLSKPTYKGITIEAERFNHDLTLQFGALASTCKDDDQYLNKAEALIRGWLQEEYFKDIIDDIFYGEPINERDFRL